MRTVGYLTCVARVGLRCTFCERPSSFPLHVVSICVPTVAWRWATTKVGGCALCGGVCVGVGHRVRVATAPVPSTLVCV
jgi:hypothetical protein